MVRLVSADRKAMVTPISTLYNHREQEKHLRIHNMSKLEIDR